MFYTELKSDDWSYQIGSALRSAQPKSKKLSNFKKETICATFNSYFQNFYRKHGDLATRISEWNAKAYKILETTERDYDIQLLQNFLHAAKGMMTIKTHYSCLFDEFTL